MGYRRLDIFSNAAAWQATDGGGAASVELSVAGDAGLTRFGAGSSLALTASADAQGHRAERVFGAVDLSAMDELRLWMRSTRAGDGSVGSPPYLEFRVQSAAVGFDDPANTWRRLLPVTRAGTWELVRMGLADMPANLRGAVTGVRLTCVDESLAFTAHLDALFAAQPQMIADVEAALIERLDGAFTVGGVVVGAELYHSTNDQQTAAPAPPTLRIRHEAVAAREEEARAESRRRDYTSVGYAVEGRATVYALTYLFEGFLAQRAHESQLMGGLLAELAPRSEVIVGGVPAPVRWLGSTPSETAGRRPALRFEVLASLLLLPPTPAIPVDQVEVVVDAP